VMHSSFGAPVRGRPQYSMLFSSFLCAFAPACIPTRNTSCNDVGGATRHTLCSEMARAARSVAGRSWREIFSGRRASWIGRMLAIVATDDFGFSLPMTADTEVAGPKNTISDE
jgi:hypothetical protein